MRTLPLVFLFFILLNQGFSQYQLLPVVKSGQNPSNLNTDLENQQGAGLTSGWQTILQGPQTSGNWSATFQIPFKFYFNGALVKNYKASTSGILTFNTKTNVRIDSNNIALPTSRIPDSSICIWGLRAATGDYIVIKTFGLAPHRQLWISYNSFSEQNLQSGGHIFASIVLEESTNKIFIVDQRTLCRSNGVDCPGKTNLTLGIQIDSTNAIMVPGSPDYASDNLNSPTTSDNSYYEFIPGSLSAFDVEAQKHALKNLYLFREFPISISATYKNIGSNSITKVQYNYQVDNGPVQTAIISGLNALSFSDFNVSHPLPWQISDTKYTNHLVKSWISTINDMPTSLTADDTLISVITVNDTIFTRNVLHESFTSSTSQASKTANDTLHHVLAGYSGLYSEINYPMNSPQGGDPYHTIEAASRARYYNLGFNAVPTTVLDGNLNGSSVNYSAQAFLLNQQIPAFYQITTSGRVKSQHIEVEVKVANEAPLSSTTRLYAALCEKKTVKNTKTNGESQFYHILKKFLTDTSGLILDTMPPDSEKTFQFTWDVPGSYRLPIDGRTANIINLNTEHSIEDFSNLEVVAWLQQNDHDVLQSNSTDLTYTVSNEQLSINEILFIKPNPAREFIEISITSLPAGRCARVYVNDIYGRTLYQSKLGSSPIIVDVSSWTPGFYYLRAIQGEAQIVEKILIQR